MRTSKSRCRITGVKLGEVSINCITYVNPNLAVKCALVDDDGLRYGLYTTSGAWSEKTDKLLAELIASIEDDVITAVFDVPDSSESPMASPLPSAEEPKQF